MARGRRPRAILKTEGTVFPNTDRPRPVNNVFIFSFLWILFAFFSNWEKEMGEKVMKSLKGFFLKRLELRK